MTILKGKRPQNLNFDRTILLPRKTVITNKTYTLSEDRADNRADIELRGIGRSGNGLAHCLSIFTRRSNVVSINCLVAGTTNQLTGGPFSVHSIRIAVLSMSLRSRL